MMTEEEMRSDLEARLSHRRFVHSLGVSEEAVRLAKIYGANVDKCRIAGLLHDCAKELTKAEVDALDINWRDFDGGNAYAGRNERVLHGFTGRILAERRYGVTDRTILDAIGNHVTGAPEMDICSQIIFIADYTEKNRQGELFEKTRSVLAEKGLMEAIKFSCDTTIGIVRDRGEALDITTVETRNWAIGQLKSAGGDMEEHK